MEVKKAVDYCLEYHRINSQTTTFRSYGFLLYKFAARFEAREIEEITSDKILSFLTELNEGTKQGTRHNRFALLSAFFTFIRNTLDPEIGNPCDSTILKKTFRPPKLIQWTILEKEVVDEIIFRTTNPRNRLLLELMARGGLRISEVLKLTPRDVDERKIILRHPKSGKDEEIVFLPGKVSLRLKDYIREKEIGLDKRIFPIEYSAARVAVKRAGQLVNIDLRPHDLRRHAATFASRSGMPIEIVSKVILRHSNLSTTQRYLGKVSDTEAMRWIENLYG